MLKISQNKPSKWHLGKVLHSSDNWTIMSSVRCDTCNFRFCPPEQALLSLKRNILWFYYTDQKFWSDFAYLFDRTFLKLCRCFIQTEITISMSGVALSHPMFVFSGERLLKLNFVSALRQKNAQICDLNRRLGLWQNKEKWTLFLVFTPHFVLGHWWFCSTSLS